MENDRIVQRSGVIFVHLKFGAIASLILICAVGADVEESIDHEVEELDLAGHVEVVQTDNRCGIIGIEL